MFCFVLILEFCSERLITNTITPSTGPCWNSVQCSSLAVWQSRTQEQQLETMRTIVATRRSNQAKPNWNKSPLSSPEYSWTYLMITFFVTTKLSFDSTKQKTLLDWRTSPLSCLKQHHPEENKITNNNNIFS